MVEIVKHRNGDIFLVYFETVIFFLIFTGSNCGDILLVYCDCGMDGWNCDCGSMEGWYSLGVLWISKRTLGKSAFRSLNLCNLLLISKLFVYESGDECVCWPQERTFRHKVGLI